MKKIIIIISTNLILLSFTACNSHKGVNPSQNSALNSVSASKKSKENGTMQKNLDHWIKNDWDKITQEDEKIKQRDENKSRDFRLQDYVEKAMVYHKNKKKSHVESHVEKVNKLPIIGK